MPEISCPECGSNNLRRSHTHGVSENLQRFKGCRAFRCREESCRWRGLIKTKSLKEALKREVPKVKQKWGKKILILSIIILTMVTAILIIIFWGNYEVPPSADHEQKNIYD
jgi:hypothetical protein